MTTREQFAEKRGASVKKALEARGFEAYYCATGAEAKDLALSLIEEGSSVSWGGSVTIREIGLTEAVNNGNYRAIDRDKAACPEEKDKLHHEALLADYYLTSTNGISEDGELVNVDGTGNRVAAMVFGPKHVIVVAGINKISKTTEDALTRVRTVAAPLNHFRVPGKTPCTETGVCADCKSPACICNQILITRNCRPAGRVKVILVGEELGF